MGELTVGKIKFFDATKGWGFIKKEGADDQWFHINDFNGSNEEGFKTPDTDDTVSYEIGVNKKDGRTKAINIDYCD